MNNFEQSYIELLKDEGGHANDPDDFGGETYRGISRNNWPQWEGWEIIDQYKKRKGFPLNLDSDSGLQEMVKNFYRKEFWDANNLDQITNYSIAESIFNFAVNASSNTSVGLAQMVVGATVDGDLGPKTQAALNAVDPEQFVKDFALAKIFRYISIVRKKRTQEKYFFNWVTRSVESIKL